MLNELIGEIDELLAPDVCDSIVEIFKKNVKHAELSRVDTLEEGGAFSVARESQELAFWVGKYFDDHISDIEKMVEDSKRLWDDHVVSFINTKSKHASPSGEWMNQDDLQRMLSGDDLCKPNLEIKIVEYKKDEKQGYHTFHSDALLRNPELPEMNRFISLIVYLNDVEEGGETEFWFGDKIKPKKGKVLIFPSIFPFMHKGNIPISHDKYILQIFLNNPPDYIRLIEILHGYRRRISELNRRVREDELSKIYT